jgi:glycosyltransferase involved in cell wall biosynthesis
MPAHREHFRVLFAVHGYPPEGVGGTESYVREAAEALRRAGHEVTVVAGSPVPAETPRIERTTVDGAPLVKLRRSGLYVDHWIRSDDPATEELWRATLREFRPDVVHVHHWIRLSRRLVRVAAEEGIRSVVTLHDAGATCPRAFRLRDGAPCDLVPGGASCFGCADAAEGVPDDEARVELDRFVADFAAELGAAAVVTAPSAAHLAALRPHLGPVGARARVVPLGALGRGPTAFPASPRVPGAPIRLGWWGRLAPLKGAHLLLEALRTLPPATRTRFRVLLRGAADDPGYEARIAALCEGLSVERRGAFAPADLSDAPFDLAVLPFLARESYSFALDEAFALGVPALVPDHGAPPERLCGAGATFRPGDAADLAARLAEIAAEPERLDVWRARVPAQRTMAAHVVDLLALYAEAATAGPSPTPPRDDAARAARLAARLDARTRALVDAENGRAAERSRAGGAERALAGAEESVRVLRAEVARKDSDLAAFARSVAELRAAAAEKESALADFATSVRELRALADAREAAVVERDAALRRRDADLAGFVASVAELRAALAAKEADLAGFRDAEAGWRERAARAERDLDGFRRSVEELRALADRKEAERTGFAASVDAHARRLEEKDRDLGEFRRANDELRALADRKEAERAAFAASVEQHARRLAATEAEAAALRRDAEAAKAEALAATAAAGAAASLRAQVAELRFEVAASAARADESVRTARAHERGAALAKDEARRTAEAARIAETEARRQTERATAAEAAARAAAEAAVSAGRAREESLAARSVAEQRAAASAAAADAEAARTDAWRERALRAEADAEAARRAAAAAESAAAAAVDAARAQADRLRRVEADASAWERAAAEGLRTLGAGGGAADPGALVAAASGARRALDAATGYLRSRPDDAAAAAALKRAEPRRRLKILFVIHDFLPYHAAGSEIYTYECAKAASARHDVRLVFCENRPERPQYEARTGVYDGLPFVEIVHHDAYPTFDATWRDAEMERAFDRVLADFRPDVVHFQHWKFFGVGCFARAKASGAVVLATLHEYLLLCPRDGQMLRADGERCLVPVPEKCADCVGGRPLAESPAAAAGRLAGRALSALPLAGDAVRRFGARVERGVAARVARPGAPAERAAAVVRRLEDVRRALAHVDFAMAPSRFLRDRFLAAGALPAEKIVHWPYGHDHARFQAAARVPSDALRVGYLGTISAYKGVGTLVDALNLLADAPVEGRIHGALEIFPDFVANLRARATNPRIRFLGRFDNRRVGELLSEIDVLVVPSLWWENAPLTISEAFLAGVPVVTSDIGGMAEMVRDGVEGFRTPPGDAAALAAALRRFVDDPALRERLRPRAESVRDIRDDAAKTEREMIRLVDAAEARREARR